METVRPAPPLVQPKASKDDFGALILFVVGAAWDHAVRAWGGRCGDVGGTVLRVGAGVRWAVRRRSDFRRQVVMPPFIVDFAARCARLIVA